ncbi:hypothetical protein CPB83DRAFT_565189 [Crepidotus variabilis]|uniref:Uncharacterized protein n=1 Tax=Crepidotus variabilis TaxID=179855 RepID=A0A9P6JLU9_9AGAR|nr:hypothetical protein CPB83DRAFT_565189 [Crepidotus variabilis]
MPGSSKLLRCDSAYQLSAAMGVFGRIGILTVWGIRTSAIYHGNKFVIGFFGALGLVIVILAAQHVPYVVCSGGRAISTGMKVGTIDASRTKEALKLVPAEVPAILTAVYEVLSVILATVQCIRTLRSIGPLRYQKRGLVYVIMQQGLLYFGLIFLLAFTNLILLYVPSIKGTWFERGVNALNIPLSGMMTARYLLYLREWDHAKTRGNTESTGSPLTELDFQRNPPDSAMSIGASGSDATGRGWMEEVINDSLFTTGDVGRLHRRSRTEQVAV